MPDDRLIQAGDFLWLDDEGTWHMDVTAFLKAAGIDPTSENIAELTERLDTSRYRLPPGAKVVIEQS